MTYTWSLNHWRSGDNILVHVLGNIKSHQSNKCKPNLPGWSSSLDSDRIQIQTEWNSGILFGGKATKKHQQTSIGVLVTWNFNHNKQLWTFCVCYRSEWGEGWVMPTMPGCQAVQLVRRGWRGVEFRVEGSDYMALFSRHGFPLGSQLGKLSNLTSSLRSVRL